MEFIKYNVKLLIKMKKLNLSFFIITLILCIYCLINTCEVNSLETGYRVVFNRKYLMYIFIPYLIIISVYILNIFKNIFVVSRIDNIDKFICEIIISLIVISIMYSIYTLLPFVISYSINNGRINNWITIIKWIIGNSFNYFIFICGYILISNYIRNINTAALMFLISIYIVDAISSIFTTTPVFLEWIFNDNENLFYKLNFLILCLIIYFGSFKIFKKDVY